MKKIVDVGRISSFNVNDYSAKVFFEDTEYMSAELPILFQENSEKGSWIPNIGQMVVCVFMDNSSDGFILGTFKGGDA